MSDGQVSIQTEADALKDILQWSENRPVWQRDALRHLFMLGELTDENIDKLTALCKDNTLANEPLSQEHLGSQTTGAPTVALKKLLGVENVNALAEGQSLTFIPKGVTIIYGNNGAGKSGYVRILKSACRARTVRGKQESILPNIYEGEPGQQKAELEYHVGAKIQKASWENGQLSDDLLSEISVFDSRTADIYVEETNDLAYTPYPMKLLERLVNACTAVKSKLDSEISTIQAQTPKSISKPNCSPDTATGKLISKLNKNTKNEDVITLASLSEAETKRLAELALDFAHDPEATAKRLRAQKSRLETLHFKLEGLASAVSKESVDSLLSLQNDLKTKRAAAKLAALDLSKDEPLPGVGSETWHALWKAARAYSTTEVYPELEFPNIAEGSHCVLCQQELDQEATSRLQQFEAFVQDKTQQEEGAAQQAFDDFRIGLADKGLSLEDFPKEMLFLSDELGNSNLAYAVRKFAVRAKWRLRAMLKTNSDVEQTTPVLADVGLEATIASLEARATALLADDDTEERKKLRAELQELRDRQWLAGIKDDVLAEISRLKSIAKLETALQDTRSNTITSKNTGLSEALITDRLRRRFTQEIDRLNLAGLAIELKQAGSKHGVSRFQISLIQGSSRNAGDILSEGEYRCVALAGFMAELATNNSDSGIIFDDPVSSLDHLHREVIAKRLAQEGRKRQVIVFTHDLPFLFLLRNACAQVDGPAEKTEVALRHVQKKQNMPGHCRNEAPEKAQDAQSRLNSMRNHLDNTRIQYDQDPDGTSWLITARGLINSLRQAWEVAVEDSISPVLRTFSSKIDTRGFIKLSAITLEDAETMRKHYGQCSTMLHKASNALNPSAPTPDIIEEELEELEKWLVTITERQSKIKPN